MGDFMSLVNVHDIDGKSYSVDSAELIFNPAVYGVVIRDGQELFHPMAQILNLFVCICFHKLFCVLILSQ